MTPVARMVRSGPGLPLPLQIPHYAKADDNNKNNNNNHFKLGLLPNFSQTNESSLCKSSAPLIPPHKAITQYSHGSTF